MGYTSIKKIELYPQIGYKQAMKTDWVKLRLTPAEKAGFQEAAEIAGLSLSAWMRERLRGIAIRELEGAGRPVSFVRGVPLRMGNDG
jgi:hypothetical protein